MWAVSPPIFNNGDCGLDKRPSPAIGVFRLLSQQLGWAGDAIPLLPFEIKPIFPCGTPAQPFFDSVCPATAGAIPEIRLSDKSMAQNHEHEAPPPLPDFAQHNGPPKDRGSGLFPPRIEFV